MSSYQRRKTPGNTEWFIHDRFGMFIHFGLYSMSARHEWIMTREKSTIENYSRYFENFNPDLLDVREWAKQAKKAGMKYAVLTTKHHEGFCLFDSKYTEYKITNTPYGKDLIKEYADAFRAEGLKVGLYYSLLDWYHPDYIIDRHHPRRDDADAAEQNKLRDMKKYNGYMRNQVRELLTRYGKIDIMWFDFSFENNDKAYPHLAGKSGKSWEAAELISVARSLQPDIIIDNRTGIEQDLCTPEQYQVDEWPRHAETGELLTWEACHTFSGSWGYYRDEMTWKSPEMLLELLIKSVSKGGNMLMNVGPCGRGYFDSRAIRALEVYSNWMRYNSASIYGCTMAEPEFEAPQGTVLTQSEDGSKLYVHLLNYPFSSLAMKGLVGKIKYVQFLHDASEIKISVGKPSVLYGDQPNSAEMTVFFNLPVIKPDTLIPVIEILLNT